MNTGLFFLLACVSTTSVQCTLVSIARTGLSTISVHADGRGEMEDDVGLVDQLGDDGSFSARVDRVLEADGRA